MSLNFPDSPSLNQIYQQDGMSYEWTGSKWRRIDTSENSIVVEYSDIVEQTANTVSIEPDKYNYFKIDVDDNATITIPSASPYSNFVVELALASANNSVSWSNNIEWTGGSAPSYNYGYTAKVLLDFITYDGTNWIGSELLDYEVPVFPTEAFYETPGSHTFTVPSHVTTISVVCIGAGGGDDGVPAEGSVGAPPGNAQITTAAHSWFNSTSHLLAEGGRSSYRGGSGGNASGSLMTAGYSGGTSPYSSSLLCGGGGAAGYGGNGGNGFLYYGFSSGGGVGAFGGDPSEGGALGGNNEFPALDGKGVNGGTDANGYIPGEYGGGRTGGNRNNKGNTGGGGGALAYANNISVTPGQQFSLQVGDGRGGQTFNARIYDRPGGMGAVRIIYGTGRSFPNTNTEALGSQPG